MSGTAEADAIAARLWQAWISWFIHEMRTPTAALGGYIKMAKAEGEPEKRAHLLQAAQLHNARCLAFLGAAQQCSLGQATTVDRLVRALCPIFKTSVKLTVARADEAPVPSDCFGIALWRLTAAQVGARAAEECVRLEVHATEAGGRIALMPEDSTGLWRRIENTDLRGWWLEDVVNYLEVTGVVIDAFSRGNSFSMAMTWTRPQ